MLFVGEGRGERACWIEWGDEGAVAVCIYVIELLYNNYAVAKWKGGHI